MKSISFIEKKKNTMRELQKLFLVSTFFLAFIFPGCKNKEDGKLAVEIEIGNRSLSIEKSMAEEFKQPLNAYSIIINLKNNTDSTIKYQSMSCSWYVYFKFNSRGFNLYNSPCDQNYPIVEEIKPHQMKTIEGTVLLVHDSINSQTAKIGFVVVNGSELEIRQTQNKTIFEIAKENHQIIWSNEFKIPERL
ncbi:MAG: hypothetical protein KA285_02395 [Bacteroidia bacterium]|nr:hypothetical protein [Bacteroidia bacterium]